MSVVQISKIQIRRGKKSVNGVPQLSAAEFAWAVDSQELYIGNGSVAEGAPYVGNTRVLTEHDNMLELAAGYKYAETNNAISGTTARSLQSKLDEYVSVLDFGAVGDGIANNVTAFETAFAQLFKNVQIQQRKVLVIPNGVYNFSGNLRIPSNAIIKGETPNGAILNFSTYSIRFVTTDGMDQFSSTHRPTNVHLSNLTIARSTGAINLSGLSHSTFSNITVKGLYSFSTPISSIAFEPPAVTWTNDTIGTSTTHIDFINCNFVANSLSIGVEQTDSFVTYINFVGCNFITNYTSIRMIGTATQQNTWKISQSKFEEIYSTAIYFSNGTSTVIQNSSFKLCGNGTNTAMYPVDPMVYFGEQLNNSVIDCTSDRHSNVNELLSSTIIAIPEVVNGSLVSFTDFYTRDIDAILSGNVCSFAFASRYININYVLLLHTSSSETYTRTGKLRLTIGESKQLVTISDDYLYSPVGVTSTGAAMLMNFEFSVVVKDNNNDTVNDTILLLYNNPTTGVFGTMTYNIAYGV